MRIKLVGRSGLRSGELALGSMTFGESRAWGADADESERIMAAFVERGGTTIDTAPNYSNGASEEIIGRFARARRDQLVLSTKYTASPSGHPLAGGNSRRSMVSSVEGSLRRLQTDRIDLLWLHFWDFTTPLDEILRAADDLVRAGKILYFGLSDTPAWLASRAVAIAELTRSAPVIALQLEYNLISRSVEPEFLSMAKACELGVFCWGPLAAGALAGGTGPVRRPTETLPADVKAAVLQLQEIATSTGVSPCSLALRWLLQRSLGACFPIVGARNAPQLAEVLTALDSELSPETMEALSMIAAPAAVFPDRLINSNYLRKFALGDPNLFDPIAAPRR